MKKKVESDGTRLEVTPLEAPWRNGKTERAGKDWKEDYYKMTQDGSEAQTWTDFEEDCDAANQARASKINDIGYSAYQRVFSKNPPQMEDAVLDENWLVADRRLGTRTVDDNETHCPTGKPGIGSQTSMETSCAARSKTLQGRTARWTSSLVLERTQQKKKTTSALWHPGVVISNTLATVWIVYRGSVVKSARSQVRPFTEDDGAAHEHITEHMRDLGERLLLEGDFSCEDITGQDEPPVDSPPAPEETQRQDIKNQMEQGTWVWTPNIGDVCEKKPD